MLYEKLAEIKKKRIKLNRDTKAYNYKYATLEQIQEKINPILDELGLVVFHKCDGVNVITTIADTEGNTIESSIPLGTVKPQDKGSEITYYRRYNLLMLLDLETEDDDGQQAQGSKSQADDKPWFNDKQFENLQKAKNSFSNGQEALNKAKEKYKVSKKMQEQILNIYK